MKKRSLLMVVLSLVLVFILAACNGAPQSSESGDKEAKSDEAKSEEAKNEESKKDVFFNTPRPAKTEDKETMSLLDRLHGVYADEIEGRDLFIVFDKDSQLIKLLDLGMNQSAEKKEAAQKEGFKIEEGLGLVEYSGMILREREGEILVLPQGLLTQELSNIEDISVLMKIEVQSDSVLLINGERYLKFKEE